MIFHNSKIGIYILKRDYDPTSQYQYLQEMSTAITAMMGFLHLQDYTETCFIPQNKDGSLQSHASVSQCLFYIMFNSTKTWKEKSTYMIVGKFLMTK